MADTKTLPQPTWPAGFQGQIGADAYTADQMRAYAEAALDDQAQAEPIGFMSPKQVERIRNPADEAGAYIPMRKSPAGNFTLALHTAPQAQAEPTWSVDECARVLATLRYVQGIAERGEGRPMRDDETLEQFVLGYVQRLEGAPAHGAPDLPHKHDGCTPAAVGNLIYALEMWKVTTPTEAPPAFSRLVAAAQGLVDAASTTAPQPVRQPLTDERITQCWGESQGTRNGYVPFTRAVERAHGITGEKA